MSADRQVVEDCVDTVDRIVVTALRQSAMPLEQRAETDR